MSKSKLDQIRGANPAAAHAADSARQALATIEKLREVGAAKGRPALSSPNAGRYDEPSRIRRKSHISAFKTTLRA